MTISWWIVEQIATTALLVAIVATICRPLSNRPAVQHLLWLVVLARFMAPPGIGFQVTAPQWLKPSAVLESAASVPVAIESGRISASNSAVETALPPMEVEPQ